VCLLIGIDREGRWHLDGASLKLLSAEDPRLISLNTEGTRVALTPDGADGALIARDSNASGLSYAELLDRLIELGIEDFEARRRLRCRP